MDDRESDRKRRRREYQAAWYRDRVEATRVLDEHMGVQPTRRRGSTQSMQDRYDSTTDAVCRSENIVIDDGLISSEEVALIDETCGFEIVDVEKKRDIYTRTVARIGIDVVERKVCAVCDCAWPSKEMRRCLIQQRQAQRWCKKLCASSDVPEALRKYYDVSPWVPSLSGALISRAGAEKTEGGFGTGALIVCRPCYNSMASDSSKPPKFSIANGFDIGTLPETLQTATTIERRLTSMTCSWVPVTVLSGGKHTYIKGHVTLMTMDPVEIALRLPQLISEESEKFLVVIAGKMTSTQTVRAMKKHVCRVGFVRQLLEFYIENNALYKERAVGIDEEVLNVIARDEMCCTVVREVREDHAARDCREQVGTGERSKTNAEGANDSNTCNVTGEAEELQYREVGCIMVDTTSQTTVEALELARDAVLVRNQGRFLSDYEEDLLGLVFPDLFPYGRGHPGTKRKVPVSLEECCKYYLRLARRHFAQHPTFAMLVFDICGKRRVAISTTVRARYHPGQFESISRVTREELARALEEQKRRREDAFAGRGYSRKPDDQDGAMTLLRNVKISQSSMWGSGEERLRYRRQAFAMDAFFKSGAFFVTVTPSDVGTMMVSLLSGKVTADRIRQMELGDVPGHAQRVSVAGMDPVACSEYFELIIEAFIDELVGFDCKRGLPRKGGGIFGVVKAFIGAIESQGNGTLHMHGVVFVAGLPGTAEAFEKRCKDPVLGEEFKKRFCDLVDSVICYSAPRLDGGDGQRCPKCGDTNSLSPVTNVRRVAFCQLPRHSKPEATSRFSECGGSFGGCEVLREEVMREHERVHAVEEGADVIPLAETHRQNDLKTEKYCALQKRAVWPLNENGDEDLLIRLHKLRMAQIVLLTQQHNHRHLPSCFKSSSAARTGECRYSFPRKAVERTEIDGFCCLHVMRKEHNEYINAYNEVMSMALFSNHDVRALVGSGTTDAFYYCMKYATKIQKHTAGIEDIVMECYLRRAEKEEEASHSEDPVLGASSGRARVNSIAITLSRKQEVSAPMCALYLRRKTALIQSHQFAPLMLCQFMAVLGREEHDVVYVEEQNGQYVSATQYTDYKYWPKALSEISLMEFVSQYSRVRVTEEKSRQISRDLEDEDRNRESRDLLFKHEHPLASTHILRKRIVIVVPDIIGQRLPDKTKLETDQARDEYAFIALILCFPFDEERHIMQEKQTYWESWDVFERSGRMSGTSVAVINNLQAYHDSKRDAERERNIRTSLQDTYENAGDERYDISAECYSSDSDHGIESREEGVDSVTVASEGIRMVCSQDTSTVMSSLCTRMCMSALAQREACRMKAVNERKEEEVFTVISDGVAGMHLAGEVAAEYEMLKSAVVAARRGSEQMHSYNGPLPSAVGPAKNNVAVDLRNRDGPATTVENLGDSLVMEADNSKTGNILDVSSEADETIRWSHSFVEEVRGRYNLNELQSVAYNLASKALMKSYAEKGQKPETSSSEGFKQLSSARDMPKNPMLMYLGGEGGTGKSRVIEALLELSVSCGRPGTIRTCAPTGIAASLVQGQTFHSLIGLREKSSYSMNKKPSQRSVEELGGVVLLIVDEVSMLSRRNLGALNCHLRRVMERDVPFGGIHIVLCGDFFQIPPVASEPVYMKPMQYSHSGKGRPQMLDVIGYEAWRSIGNVIILKDSMRQCTDPEYAQVLRRIRSGEATNRDIVLLNTRVLTERLNADIGGEHNSEEGSFPLVVRGNELRVALNWECVRVSARKNRLKPIVVPATVRTGSKQKLSRRDMSTLFETSDNETSNLAVLLPMTVGMPVRITQNTAVELGMANGTEAKLEGVNFPAGTSFVGTNIFGTECLLASRMPIVCYLSSPIIGKAIPRRFQSVPSGFTDDTVPVTPFTTGVFSPALCGRKKLTSTKTLTMTQMPFVPSYASTTYKVQGITAAGIVAFPFLRGCPGRPSSAALYVTLSRVRTLQSLFLSEPITAGQLKHFSPPQQLLEEEQRLEVLHNATVANYNMEHGTTQSSL